MRLLKALSLFLSFGVSLALVLSALAHWPLWKLTGAIARHDTRQIIDVISHLAIFAAMGGFVFAGAFYLPVCWVAEGMIARWPSIPRGERLWFAAGIGMLGGCGIVLEPSPRSVFPSAPIVMPLAAMLLAFCTFWSDGPDTESARGVAWRNITGWVVSSFLLALLVPLFLCVAMTWLGLDF